MLRSKTILASITKDLPANQHDNPIKGSASNPQLQHVTTNARFPLHHPPTNEKYQTKMPAPPGMSQEEYLILKKRQKEKLDMEAAKKVYKKKYDPTTVAEEIDTDTLEQTWMKDGDWGPNWAKVEFVSPTRPIGRLSSPGSIEPVRSTR
jgi:hypothetical protein